MLCALAVLAVSDPAARRNPTVTQIGNTRYVAVMGGETGAGELLDDLHLFDHERLLYLPPLEALAPRQDTRVQALEYADDERSGRPPARRHHAACSDGGTRLFVFGGFGLGTHTSLAAVAARGAATHPARRLLNDLHVFDAATMRWSGEQSARAGRPARRWGHSLTRVGERCYLYGGSASAADALARGSTAELLTDVHYFACGAAAGAQAAAAPFEWIAPAVVGAPPAPRSFFSAAAIGSKLFVFGGEKPSAGDGMACARYNDLWALDTVTHAWSRVADGGFGGGGGAGLDSLQPATRAHHTLLASGTVLLLTGGVDGLYHKTLDDAWTFETDAARPGAGAWAGLKDPVAHSRVATQLATNRALEPRTPDGTTTRLEHGTAVDAAGTGRIFVFGGKVRGVLANSMDIYSGAAARMQWLYRHVSAA